MLRQLLGDASVLDEGEEKYGLSWHGKKKARQIALTPSMGTLLPCPEESVDWDTTQNLFIEGDNLEVLKLLQRSYTNKVKLIYIDPPYNTGNDFVYPDNYQDNLDTYLKYTGQKDKNGLKLTTNTETGGRKHTNWLNMMYPRLKLARNLLTKDGVIFISIDDNEQANLKALCDQIFGEENFIGQVTIQGNPRGRDYGGIARMHDYLLVYKKSDEAEIYSLTSKNKKFPFLDDISGFEIRELRNRNIAFHQGNRPNLYYSFYLNSKNVDRNGFCEISLEPQSGFLEVLPKESQGYKTVWRWGKAKSAENLNTNIVGKTMKDGGFQIVEKYRENSRMARSIWNDKDVNTEKGTLLVKTLFDKKVFDFPKPVEMLERIVEMGSKDDDIVLDFFAGSATTAHAVMQLNAEDGGNRKFIMVQLPEPTGEKSEASRAGYVTIADIGKERIRRAAARIKKENPHYNGDLGFKVFKLASSNIRAWNPDPTNLEETLLSHQEHLLEGRSEQDLLYELLLKRGVALTVPMETRRIAGKTIYSIGAGVLFACLDPSLNKNEVEPVALDILAWQKQLDPEAPAHVFFRDSAFNNDNVAKTNMVAILAQNGITHVRSL